MDSDASVAHDPGDVGAADRQVVILLAQLFAAAWAFALWAAADAWQALTRLPVASALSVLTALPAGLVFATLVHEWGHFAGARIAGARCTVPAKVGLYAFNYDFAANSLRHFRVMSWAGQVGGLLAILALAMLLPLDTPGRCMVLAASVGAFFFAGMIEWPVLARVGRSGNPLAELSRIDRGVIRRSAGTGVVATVLSWIFLAF